MGSPPRTSQEKLLALLSAERGAILWIPSLLLAGAAVLFGILQAPSPRTLFNQSRELRVAIGPVQTIGVAPAAARAFESGLRTGLTHHRELSLLDAEVVRARLRAVLAAPAPADARSWMRATRNLSVQFYLSGELEARTGSLAARLQVWDVASESTRCTLQAQAEAPEALGLALADSVGEELFRPQLTTATRGF